MALNELLRNLPSVNEVLNNEACVQLLSHAPRKIVVEAVRRSLDFFRAKIRNGELNRAPSLNEIVESARHILRFELMPTMPRVINATGIIVHTGLGRSMLCEDAIRRVVEVARHACALEVDEVTGERSFRDLRVERLLCALTGAEAATVVNNNAAAVLLILNTLAEGKEVLVSRGELVEIGGGFRIPEILRKSGARLIEVGTTNKTRISDYEAAITEHTAMLLKVHQSNFRIIGFAEQVPLSELAKLARKYNLLIVEDLGSGALVDLSTVGIEKEPMAQDSISDGADLVSFSGDKLLGGPQAGIVVGRRELIERLRKNPLYRAFRCDKLTFAALEATLLCYFDEQSVWTKIPTLRQIAQDEAQIRRRANSLMRKLKRLGLPASAISIERSYSQVGGGALPGQQLPSFSIVIKPSEGDSADELSKRLRISTPSVFSRIQYDAVWLDMRTVANDEVDELARCVANAWHATKKKSCNEKN
ncbi:MAG: L-seryl-tRNA(Sec) selenium transferase [Armatimonadota bacterium]|nr:L-seryl-tRNA(Sec) selenium transferase [Armatimonadota bacterium]MDW8026663.1 L-seryl-tRNA(Sec) selenium transferase [Armatimonadota bacterium]